MSADPANETMEHGRGRPPMTKRRRDIIRLQIASAALELFKTQGVAATSVEQIAGELGISARTLWRYSPSKEGCVQPLLEHGIAVVIEQLRAWPRDRPLLEQLLDEQDLSEGTPGSTLDLVRLTRTEPALRSVWLQSYLNSETAFTEVIAERTGRSVHALETKVQAGMLNVALRLAVEHYAWSIDSATEDDEQLHSMTEATQVALRTAIAGLSL